MKNDLFELTASRRSIRKYDGEPIDDEIEFYEHCGFEKADDASPMFITDLWT